MLKLSDLTKLLVNFQHASRYTVIECNEKYFLACQIQMASAWCPPKQFCHSYFMLFEYQENLAGMKFGNFDQNAVF